MKSDLLVIIPAYNEEENIENVVSFIQKKYSKYDYIVVNDGSRDHTADICRKKGYELLNLPVNLGLASFSGRFKIRLCKRIFICNTIRCRRTA